MDYLSRNPVGEATQEDENDEEYVINLLSEQARLNLKYGQLFATNQMTANTKSKQTMVHRKTNLSIKTINHN